tara:strand:+ start:10407 stop:17462 length:7056 start_codon:yes stop_codon:yes gene_type:complete
MFELNGIKYSNEQLQEAAVKYNMDFDSYLNTMKQKGLTEVDTDNQQEINAWQSFKNNIYNAFEMVGDVPEFYGVGTGDKSVEEVAKEGNLGAYSGLNIASTLIYESVFGKNEMKEVAKKYPNFFSNFYSSDSETFQKILENFEKEKKDIKRTMTFKEADSFTDYMSVIAGSVANVGGSVAYNLGTLGTGFFMDFASDNFITANKEKAKANNITLEKLMKSGEQDVEAPFKIAAFQAGLEYFGFSKIIGKTGVGKKLNKKVGEYLTKNYKKQKNIRTGLNILGTGRVEAFTEMGQTGLEIYNKELAVAKGKGEDINDFMSITKGMFSEQGIESGLQGFFGGSGLKTGAYSAKALNNIRKTDEKLDVEKDLSNLVSLRKLYNTSKDPDVRSALQEKINKQEDLLKNKIKKGNDIYKNLSDNDIKKIEDLSDLADLTAFRADKLISKFKNNEISENEFDVAIEGLSNKYKENKQNILEVLYKENISFAKTEAEKIGKKIVEIDSFEEFQNKYNEVRTEGDFEGDVTDRDGFIKGDEIYINKQTALQEGAISVGSHELLHGIIGNYIDNLSDKDRVRLGKDFMSFLNSKQKNAVIKRLKNSYQLEGDAIYTKEGVNEMFTALSDAAAKKEVTFDKTIGQKLKQVIQELIQKVFPGGVDYKKEFSSGRQAFDFLAEYNKNIKEGKLSERALKFAEQTKQPEGVKFTQKSSISVERRNQISSSVQEIGSTYSFEGGKKAWDEGGADQAITEIKTNNYLDDLIAAKYKADRVPVDFVDKVYAELTSHIKNFNPETNDNLFGWINSQLANKAGNVYNREYKKQEQEKTAKDVDDRTKEGEVKVQVAAEVDPTLEALETEDISPAAQARKKAEQAKAEIQKKSKFRKAIGIETGSDLYNKVLDSARKALLRAYEVGTPARNIQRKLRDEANLYLFKDVKNFLGTKQYISNLKKFREAIMDVMFTADLVQMERNVQDEQRVFTKFVRKLTSKKEVEDAVNDRLLPESALNIIDKGTAVNLYEKANPTEEQFMSFFDIPAFNPVTKQRSGKRGTRKDQLAKYISGALTYDATLEVAQQPEVVEKRQQIAELKGENIDTDDIQTLAASIGRNPNIKFSRTAGENSVKNRNIVAHLRLLLKNDKIQTKEDFEKYVNDKGVFIEIGQGVKKGQEMTKKDKDLLASLGYNMKTTSKYADVKDKSLKEKLFNDVVEARSKGLSDNLGIVNEKDDIRIAESSIEKGQIVKGSGDVYVSVFGITFGLESKLGDAQWVSRTLNAIGNTLKFTTNNTTIDPKTKKQFNDIIINEVLKVRKQINNFLNDNNIETIKDFNKPLNPEQLAAVRAFKSAFQVNTTVNLQYVMNDYVVNKYAGNNAQSFLLEEGNVHLMETDSDSYRNAELAVNIFNKNKPENQQIKTLKLKEGVEFIDAHISLQISDNGVLNHRLRPKLNSDNFVSSNVNIKKDAKLAKEFFNSIEQAAEIILRKKSGKASMFSRSAKNPTKGITVLDFDDTLATTKSLVKYTTPDGKTGTLNAEQYANTYEDLLDQGYTFDFSDFNKVVKGKLAPLFNKAIKLQGKFGPKNMFVLTARPPAAQKAIFDFLKANGLNIPLENITGLGNSTAEAKALWMADKVGEGYNDFYFADDALQNVQAVKNMLDQFDVKSKVQQAKVKFSQSMDNRFNDILENVTKIESKKRFSEAKARKRGSGKGRFRVFVPPSHEDFVGLLYNFIGKGEQGNQHRDFFEQALVKPLNRAYRELNMAKQAIANDYKKLTKQMPDIRKKLTKQTPDGDFTYDDAVRVYLWDKFGFEIPGLTKTDTKKLVDYVNLDGKLKTFADTVGQISKMDDGYIEPGEHWLTGSIRQDLVDATGRVGRAKFFTEFIENADIIFSQENINKIRAAYGDNFTEALQDMLSRIKTGTNRKQGGNRQVNAFLDYLNGSIGATMFFNARSAVLQTLSTVNFINYGDNNIFKAAARFADQKQFWSDFAKLFNSDFLKQRRAGVGFDVNGAEIANAVKKAKNPIKATIAYILNKGFLPTQMADSFAIALGGSSMYRNRVNTYVKQGLTQSEAETKAFNDFMETAEATQQSARPDMISQQQASVLGRMILAFQNVTSQYTRLIKKAGLDLINRRKTPPYNTQVQSDMSNISKIIYYGAIQNVIFYGLQSALFAMAFEDDEDEDKKNEKFFKTKKERLINGSIDSILRGSGVGGAVISVLKNAVIKYGEQKEKGWGKQLGVISDELLQLSPPVGIKLRKIDSFEKTMEFNKKVIPEMDTFDLDNPIWDAYGNLTEGLTNIPVARLIRKVENVRSAIDSENAWWQRLALGLGWSKWELGIEDKEINEVKKQINKSNKSVNSKKFKKIKFK